MIVDDKQILFIKNKLQLHRYTFGNNQQESIFHFTKNFGIFGINEIFNSIYNV